MSRTAGAFSLTQHAPENAMDDPDEIERFHDRCSDLMRELLVALAAAPDHPRAFPEIEDALAWPRRRIASVLGGVWHSRRLGFGALGQQLADPFAQRTRVDRLGDVAVATCIHRLLLVAFHGESGSPAMVNLSVS